MKKYLLLIILFILFVPTVVLAEEEFTINSIEKLSITGETVEESNPTINGKNVDYNIRFFNEGDSIKYKLNVTNNTGDKLIIKDNIISLSNENVKYELEIPDGISSINKDESKDLIISITYIKKADESSFENGIYKRSDNIEFTLRNGQLIIGVPNTDAISAIKIAAIGLIIICVVGIIFTKTKSNNKISMFIIMLFIICIIPNKVDAVKELKFNMIGEIITELNPCFTDGELIEGLTYQDSTYTYKYNQRYNVSSTYSSGTYTYSYNWTSTDKNGWGVKLTNEDNTSEITSTMCTSINKKPIVALSFTYYNSKASEINTNSIDSSKVFTMQGMFMNATNITEINLNNSGSDVLETVKSMFSNCSSVLKITMKYFNFGLVSNIYNEYLFGTSTRNVEEVDLSYSNMSNNTSLEYLFRDNNKLKTALLNNINMPNVTTIAYIGYACVELETFDLSNSVTDSLTDMKYMFKGANKLKNVNYEGINLQNVEYTNYMFAYCEALEEIDLSEFTTPKLKGMWQMFTYCKNLKYINLSNWGSDVLENDYSFISGCTKLKTLIMKNFKFGKSNLELFSSNSDGHPLLETLDLSGADFSHIQSYSTIFDQFYAPILEKIDMSGSKFGEQMGGFFYNLKHVKELDLSNSDVTNVKYLNYTFANTSLTTLNLTGLKFNSLVNCFDAFYESRDIEDLDFSIFKMDNVTDARYMFEYLNKITKIDLSNWNLSNVTQHDSIFYGMSSVTEIISPKVNSPAPIYLPKTMYAKNDTTGINKIMNNTPTETIYKNEPWN